MRARIALHKVREEIKRFSQMTAEDRDFHLQKKKREFLRKNLSEVGLLTRTVNTLEAGGIYTFKQLLAYSPVELKSIKNFGETGLNDVLKALREAGFKRNSKR